MSCLHVGKPEAQRADATARGLADTGRAEKHPENKWTSQHNETDMCAANSPCAGSQGAQVNHRTYIKKKLILVSTCLSSQPMEDETCSFLMRATLANLGSPTQ